jgi:hypothetical protein
MADNVVRGIYHGPVVSQFRKLLEAHGGGMDGLNYSVPEHKSKDFHAKAKKAGHNYGINNDSTQHTELQFSEYEVKSVTPEQAKEILNRK